MTLIIFQFAIAMLALRYCRRRPDFDSFRCQRFFADTCYFPALPDFRAMRAAARCLLRAAMSFASWSADIV
jgi:hypothetical protein